MRKLNFLFGAIALAAVLSCSNDEVVSSQSDPEFAAKSSISFAPLASKTDTRSTVYTPSSMFTNFRVIGFWSTVPGTDGAYIEGKHYAGTADNDKNILAWPSDQTPSAGGIYMGFAGTETDATKKGLEIVKSGSGWDYKNQSQLQYWPYTATMSNGKVTGYACMKLNFRAVAPATAGINISSEAAWNYETPKAVADMVDVCYAEANGKEVKDAPVEMKFGHLLSQVIVKAKKASNYVVQIKDVKLGNVGSAVSYTYKAMTEAIDTANFKKNGKSDGSWVTWTPTAKGKFAGFTSTTYTSVPDQDESASPAQLTPAGQELLLLPQTITAWNPEGTDAEKKPEGDGQTGGYISITYRAKTTEATDWAADKTIYFPLKAVWAPGHKYIYTFLFGGVKNPDDDGGDDDGGNPDPGPGYNEDGDPEPPSIPITFTASVQEWTEHVINTSF